MVGEQALLEHALALGGVAAARLHLHPGGLRVVPRRRDARGRRVVATQPFQAQARNAAPRSAWRSGWSSARGTAGGCCRRRSSGSRRGETAEAGHGDRRRHRRARRELARASLPGQHGAPEAGHLRRHLLAELRVLLLLRRELQAHLAQQVEQLRAECGRHVGRAPLELTSHTVRHLQLLECVRAVQGACSSSASGSFKARVGLGE